MPFAGLRPSTAGSTAQKQMNYRCEGGRVSGAGAQCVESTHENVTV